MDIVQAQTFLEIVKLRNFHKAADKLNVKQSTVSMRIKKLESFLGCSLFIRNKAGVVLTDDAIRFERHARSIVQLWELAKSESEQHQTDQKTLSIGARHALWEPMLFNWLLDLKTQLPNTSFNAQIGTATTLIPKLHQDLIDLCIIYTPYEYQGLTSKKLFDECFVLVANTERSDTINSDDYIYVDWGEEFAHLHKQIYPDHCKATISTDLGACAENFIHNNNMMAYLPCRLAQPAINKGELYRVSNAPIITVPVYLVYSEKLPLKIIDITLESLLAHCPEIPPFL